MTEESILRKIRACLARAAEDSGCSPNERATALRQANALMDKHSIDVAALAGSTVHELGEFGTESFNLEGHHRWKAHVANSIAKLYGCKVWICGEGYYVDVFIAGRKVFREAVNAMSAYAIDAILREEKGAGLKGKRARNSFRDGAAIGINSTVLGMLRDRATEHDAAPGTALVLASVYDTHMDDALAWMAEQGVELGTARKSRAPGDGAAFSAGITAGKGISLRDQLEN